MCGVVGYIGQRQAQKTLLEALMRLEYRGYDSCGIAVLNGRLEVFKDAVRVEKLSSMLQSVEGNIGIGHTRWATCGQPNRVNAHPHADCKNSLAIAHNGTINNHLKLKAKLEKLGHVFTSDTDIEVIAHLIEHHYNGDLESAVGKSLAEIDGSYALVVMHQENQDRIIAVSHGSPLVIGIGEGENWLASDVPAILGYTNRVVYLEDNDFAVVSREAVKIQNGDIEKNPKVNTIEWTLEQAQKSGYQHFMLKEIHEQPRILRQPVIEPWTASDHQPFFTDALSQDPPLPLLLLACGTSYHAGLIAKYLIQDLLDTPVSAELASEFNYHHRRTPEPLAIVISQSGETADALLAMRHLRKAGTKILAITNVPGCSASRLADETWFTGAGPEISVAATKSFIAQLKVLYHLILASDRIERQHSQRLKKALRLLPSNIQHILDSQADIQKCARYLASFTTCFFIGRGLNYPVALEGALKLKEIAYIHATGMAGGELKHGPLALLSPETPVVAILNQDATHDAMFTTLREIKVRGAPLIVFTPTNNDGDIEQLADIVVRLPEIDTLVSPLVNTVALQLLAYYAALELGCPIDKPRNLAKSVTVE